MPATTRETQQISGKKTARIQIALSFLAFILIGANDGALGVILPGLRAHYQIDNATVSFIFLASSSGYLLASLNNGLLVEKLGNRRFLLLGTLVFVLCACTYSLMPPFPVLLIAALFLGSAVAVLDAGLNSYFASLPNNTTLLNYLHAFYGSGAWLGPVVASSLLALHWGWNTVYMVWGSIALLVMLGFATIFKEAPVSQQVEVQREGNIFLETLKLRVVWIAALFLLFYTGSEVSTGSWTYSFLTEAQHNVPLLAGWMVSGFWLGLTLGRVVLGHVAQRVGHVRLIQGSLVGVVIGVLVTWLVPTTVTDAAGLFLIGFSLGPIFPTVIAMMSTLVSARILPGAIGFLVSFANIGAALFSWSAGNLAQHIGLWSLWPLQVVLVTCMVGLWLALHKQPRAVPA
jgi:fucose permease